MGPAARGCLALKFLSLLSANFLPIIIIIIIIIVVVVIIGIQSLGRFGQRPELSQANGMALVRYIVGKFLGVVCRCYPPRLDVPTFATRCLHVRHDARDPRGGRWNCGQECCPVILPKFRDILHVANLRHGTEGFTSPPKEGVLKIFSPLKIRRLRSGFEPANLGTKGQRATRSSFPPIIINYLSILALYVTMSA